MRANEFLIERIDPSVWGYWISPNGDLLDVANDHGHDSILYKHLQKELPRRENGRLDTDKTYWESINAKKDGWIWLRTGGLDHMERKEVSISFITPSEKAKRRLSRILPGLKDYSRFFIDAWTENKFAETLMGFKNDLLQVWA